MVVAALYVRDVITTRMEPVLTFLALRTLELVMQFPLLTSLTRDPGQVTGFQPTDFAKCRRRLFLFTANMIAPRASTTGDPGNLPADTTRVTPRR